MIKDRTVPSRLHLRGALASGIRIVVGFLAAAVVVMPSALAQESVATTAASETDIISAWHARSPFTSLQKTRLLLDAIAMEVLSSYTAHDPPGDARNLSNLPAVRAARFFTRRLEGDATRTLELVAAAHPSGGFELYLRGLQVERGIEAANPELPQIQDAISSMLGRLGPEEPESGVVDRRNLAYEPYQLSYVEADRALATLKALDYSTVEFEESSAESIYDRIFVVRQAEQPRLPVVVKMLAASKTSLQESAADSGAYSGSREGLPDLGGIFLHRTTAAEPQNRLLIVYDPQDLESLEKIVNLLREVIDIPARQIVMEALVIEIQGDVTKDLGISWGVTGESFDLQVAEEPRLGTTPLTFLFNKTLDALDFKVRLHALLQTSKAKVLSNPSVLVLDGRQAKIQIGNRIPVVETTVTNTSATESVLYFPVGIVLNLRPRVSKDGSEISMQVETIVSAARQTLASAGSSTRAPEVESRQVQTFVRVRNDTPFIIGGLTTNDEIKTRRGVPILSALPGIGSLFRRELIESVKKEIIIVVTPHLVPEDPKKFSFVIPQSSPIFDAFGRQLLYNSYRLRQQDVFDLDFLFESRAYESLVDCAKRHVERSEDRRRVAPEIMSLVEGGVPGEDILVRRMLWEIIRKTNYARFVDLNRIIFFEKMVDASGTSHIELMFLKDKLPLLEPAGRNAMFLTFDAHAEGSPEQPFGRPTGALRWDTVTKQTFTPQLAASNTRSAARGAENWSVLLTDAYSGTAAPFDVLRGVMVLKSVLALNPNLPLTVRGFQPGRQIVFPTETELAESWHLIDPEAAKLFYEVISYYPAFEDEFKHRARRLAAGMGGCQWWDGAALPPPVDAPLESPGAAATSSGEPRR